ncbi:MAG: hypothetical protein K0U66_00650, partial [Gammaproteobacteria bacterium]|nr:hypothetical protein [Gammaproteobacteria bacterium]
PKAKCISRRRPSASVAAINRSLLEIDPNSETDLTTGEVGSSTASHSVFAFSQSTREQIARADLHGVENPQDEGGQTAVADEEVSTGEQAQSAALLMSGWFEGGNGEAEGLRSRTTAQTLAAAFTYDEIERTIFAVRNDVKAQSPGAIVARLQGKYLGPLYQLTKRDRRSELYLSLHPEHAQEIEREDAAAALNPQMTAAEGMDYKSYAAQFEAAGII